MDKLALQIKIICLVSILAGILSAVIPKGRMKGAYLSFCAVVMISSMIMPFKNLSEKDFDFFSSDNSQISESLSCEVRTAEVMLYEKIVADAIESNLEKKGIAAAVSVKGEDGEEKINITFITVEGSFDMQQKQEITVMLQEGFHEAEIILKEAENE